MAPLNPDLKDISPVNPIGWSKPATVPEKFASATEAGIKGAGQLIGDATKAADELIKQDAQRATEDAILPVRDDYAAQLSGADFNAHFNQAASAVTPIAPSTGPGTPISKGLVNLGTTDEQPMPSELKALGPSLELLDSAKANGKLSPTGYYGRLMSIAQDLRSRYPVGYREYIDHQISKITGVDPANAYIHSIIGDINSFQTDAKAEISKTTTEMMKFIGADPVNGPAMIDAVSRGKISPKEGLQWASKFASIEYKNKAAVDALHLKDMDEKDRTASADRTFSQYTTSKMAAVLATSADREGMGPAQIQKILVDQLQGKAPSLTDVQHQALLEYLAGIKQTMVNDFRQELYKTDSNPDSKTYRPNSHASLLRGRGNEITKDAMLPIDDMMDLVKNKEYGTAFQNINKMKAMESQFAAEMFKNPSYQQQSLYAKNLKGIYGENAMTQVMMLTAGLSTLPSVKQEFITTAVNNLLTPPDPRGPDFKDFNSPAEVIKRVQSLQSKGIEVPQTYAEVRNRIYGPTLSLTNPNTGSETGDIQLIKNIGYKYFSPEGRGFLKLIKPDEKDDKGQWKEGNETWFAGFSRPEVAQAIARTKDPTLMAQYHESIKTYYETIFQRRVQNLNNISNVQVQTAGGTKEIAPYAMSWDDKNAQLSIVPNPRVALSRGQLETVNNLKDEVLQLNKGLTGLRNSYHAQGYSDAAVQQKVLESLNFNVKQFQSIKGLPVDFQKILSLKYEEMKREEAAKAASKANFK